MAEQALHGSWPCPPPPYRSGSSPTRDPPHGPQCVSEPVRKPVLFVRALQGILAKTTLWRHPEPEMNSSFQGLPDAPEPDPFHRNQTESQHTPDLHLRHQTAEQNSDPDFHSCRLVRRPLRNSWPPRRKLSKAISKFVVQNFPFWNRSMRRRRSHQWRRRRPRRQWRRLWDRKHLAAEPHRDLSRRMWTNLTRAGQILETNQILWLSPVREEAAAPPKLLKIRRDQSRRVLTELQRPETRHQVHADSELSRLRRLPRRFRSTSRRRRSSRSTPRRKPTTTTAAAAASNNNNIRSRGLWSRRFSWRLLAEGNSERPKCPPTTGQTPPTASKATPTVTRPSRERCFQPPPPQLQPSIRRTTTTRWRRWRRRWWWHRRLRESLARPTRPYRQTTQGCRTRSAPTKLRTTSMMMTMMVKLVFVQVRQFVCFKRRLTRH